eukprot:jgi/Orpsp1_1/1191165/evm.model.d7180000083897.1
MQAILLLVLFYLKKMKVIDYTLWLTSQEVYKGEKLKIKGNIDGICFSKNTIL